MELPILHHPDPRLREVAPPVDTVDAEARRMVTDLFETHYAQTNCAALAATQLGLMRRITVIDFSEKKNEPLCLINPEIIKRSTALTHGEEGCMSLPGIHAKVKRAEVITVKALDKDGKPLLLENVGGFMARCIQHEIDHLDGILFTDHLANLKKNIVLAKYFRQNKGA